MPVVALLSFGGKLSEKCWSTAFRLRRASVHRCSNCDYSSRHSPSDESDRLRFTASVTRRVTSTLLNSVPLGKRPCSNWPLVEKFLNNDITSDN